ncbi:MAG: hypothetical protein M3512_08140 [Bacteroidota bacterium]|nr:hypothetical protein [Bacteroidota bacterium]
MSIYNDRGTLVYTEFLKDKKGISLAYDFNKLPKGLYKVKLMANKKRYTTTINHDKEPAQFFKSYLKSENGSKKYALKVVRQSMEPVMVTILDKNDKVLFSETIDVDYNFERIYDLSPKKSDAKSIVLNSGRNSVVHSIK